MVADAAQKMRRTYNLSTNLQLIVECYSSELQLGFSEGAKEGRDVKLWLHYYYRSIMVEFKSKKKQNGWFAFALTTDSVFADVDCQESVGFSES